MARHRVPEGPAPAPAVQKVWVRYAKRGRLRFSSTRDFQRALERAVRRAGVPMAFSAGFHPHPRISYANAAPTGTASEAEFFQLQLTQVCDVERLREALDASLPSDLAVLRVVDATSATLADLLQASTWRLDFEGLPLETLTEAVDAFLTTDEVLVSRMTKSGNREFDVRRAVLTSEVVAVPANSAAEGSAGAESPAADPAHGAAPRDVVRWNLTIEHTTPAVRPGDVMTGLTQLTGLQVPRSPLTTRLLQGVLGADGVVRDPFDA